MAHPLEDLGIIFRDQAVELRSDGPNRPKDETLQGAIGLVPRPITEAEAARVPGLEVTDTVFSVCPRPPFIPRSARRGESGGLLSGFVRIRVSITLDRAPLWSTSSLHSANDDSV